MHPARQRIAVAFVLAALLLTWSLAAGLFTNATAANTAKSSASTLKPFQEEWVYRVKWGFGDEFWQIFRRTQIPILDRKKALGDVLSYQVFKPGLHTSEDFRWDYRVVITYKDVIAAHRGEAAIEQALFPDQAEFKQQEHRRWELIVAHYDLPIEEFDPHADTIS